MKEVHHKLSPRLMSTEFILDFMTEVQRAQANKDPIDIHKFVASLEIKLSSVIVHSWHQALLAMLLAFHGDRSALECSLGDAVVVELGAMTEVEYQRILKLIDGDEWLDSRAKELREKAMEDNVDPTPKDEG